MANSLIVLALLVGLAAVAVGWRAGQREAAAEAGYPPEGRFLTVAGRQVHAVVTGEGPDLVLIHGASGSSRDFTFDLVGRLAGEYRVIAFDRPGMGWSDPLEHGTDTPIAQARALRAAALALGVDRPVVLGHSYGGAVAMAWALEARGGPDEPAALVLLAAATHSWPGDLGLWYRIADSGFGRRVVIPLIAALAPMAQAEAVVDSVFAPQQPPPGYDDHIGVGLSLRREALQINTRQVNGLKPHVTAMAPHYPALRLPIELVHGTADTIVGLALHSEPMAARVDSATLTVLEGIGHMPHHADPEAVIAAIDRAASRAGLR